MGSPDVPAGHLQTKLPTVFSQKAPVPQEALGEVHSSISIQARCIGSSWNPGKHRHIGIAFCTKHCELGKQVAVSQGSSQLGPTLGSGHKQDPALQMAFPGHCSLLVQATAPPHRFVTGSKGAPLKHVHLKEPAMFWHLASRPQIPWSAEHSLMS